MEADPFYRTCCVSGVRGPFVKIDWHHNLIFAGRQVNEKWCILPLAQPIHDRIVEYKEIVDWIMLNRATDEELRRYSKAVDLISKRAKLNKKYGAWKGNTLSK